jgi:hypothetical protein
MVDFSAHQLAASVARFSDRAFADGTEIVGEILLGTVGRLEVQVRLFWRNLDTVSWGRGVSSPEPLGAGCRRHLFPEWGGRVDGEESPRPSRQA